MRTVRKKKEKKEIIPRSRKPRKEKALPATQPPTSSSSNSIYLQIAAVEVFFWFDPTQVFLCVAFGKRHKVKTSFPVYVAALTGFVGWFIFVVFAGIGLASCPGDLIRK